MAEIGRAQQHEVAVPPSERGDLVAVAVVAGFVGDQFADLIAATGPAVHEEGRVVAVMIHRHFDVDA